jgi:hypothetical protein
MGDSEEHIRDQVYAFNDRARALINRKKHMKPEWFTEELVVLAKDFMDFYYSVEEFPPLLGAVVDYVAQMILHVGEVGPLETERVFEVRKILTPVWCIYYKSDPVKFN